MPSPTVERPALLDVLSVLTATAPEHLTTLVKWPGEHLAGVGCCRATCDDTCSDSVYPWQITKPAEALEALTTAGVLPESWAQDERRAWWCAGCEGRGVVRFHASDGGVDADFCDDCAVKDADATGGRRRVGHTPHPLTIPTLVAWASLGHAAITRAEALARETVADLKRWKCPQPDRVVWRVLPPGAVRDGSRGAWSGDSVGLPMLRIDGFAQHGSNRVPWVPIQPALDLWTMGLHIDSITADAITLCVPPVS